MSRAVAAVREMARGPVEVAADPAGSQDDVNLKEQLHLAELERDIWEKACKAATRRPSSSPSRAGEPTPFPRKRRIKGGFS